MLKWTKIQSILKKQKLIMTFNALRDMTSEYITQMFRASDNQNYQLRHKHRKLFLSKPKTDFLKRSFSYSGASSWNQISMEKISAKTPEISINSFNEALKVNKVEIFDLKNVLQKFLK